MKQHPLARRGLAVLCTAAALAAAFAIRAGAQATSPHLGTPVSLPGTVQAENFDNGGINAAYWDKDAGNKGGVYRSTDVDIQTTADTGGGYNVGWMAAGEWLQYTVSVAAAGTYTLQLRVASAQQGGTLHVEFEGTDATGPMTIPATGSYQTWTTISRPVTLDAGTQAMRVRLDSAGPSGGVGNLNWIRVASASGTPASLFRQPYLQQVTSSSAIVVWGTPTAGQAQVRYQAAGQPARTAAATSTRFTAAQTGLPADYYQHAAALGALAPATEYTYDVLLDGADLTGATDRFRTAPSEGTSSVRFIAFGDSGVGSAEQRQLAGRMATDNFDLAIHTGDVAYGTSSMTGGGSHRTLHDWFFAIYDGWLRRRPFFPSIGNHDDEIAFARPYRDVFVLPPDGASSGYPDHAERFYSFDHGPAHFVALDTERAFQDPSRRAAQLAWLEADLAATAQPWRIAYFHRSPYSSSVGHGSDLAVRQAFVPIFERYGVQLVISGHDHGYERSTPWRQTSGGRPVTYVVTGGGGAHLYAAGQSAWTVRAASAHHYVRANVTDCALYLVAVGLDGQNFDGMTLDRCAQDRDSQPPSVSITSPAGNATVSGSVVVSVAASDDQKVEKVDLWVDGRLTAIDRAAPWSFTWDSRGVGDGPRQIQARAYDIAGKITAASRTVQVANGAGGGGDIVLYPADAAAIAGNWNRLPSTTGAGGQKMSSVDRGWYSTSAVASPVDFFEIPFVAEAGTPYRVWLRLRAGGDWRENDSVWVQFSGAVDGGGAPLWRTGSTSALLVNLEDCSGCGVAGWGWQDSAWWTGQSAVVRFPVSGPQTMRIQTREDGVDVDQVVLSPATYWSTAPGALKDDTTIVPR